MQHTLTALAMAGVSKQSDFEYEFVEKVSSKLICNICRKVLYQPQLAVCCGQHFCKFCLDNWVQQCQSEKRPGSCPHCRTEGKKFQHVDNRGVEREIDELKIHCIHHRGGCAWVGDLGDLRSHLKNCGYVTLSCSNKCEKKMKRKDLGNHLLNECPLREYRCGYCGHADTFQAITTESEPGGCSHYDICVKYPLECPNKCGETHVMREEMTGHKNVCPLEPVECPFWEAGCDAKLVRKELEGHVAVSVQEHLLKSFQTLRTKVESVQFEISLLQKVNKDKTVATFLNCVGTQLQFGRLRLRKTGDMLSFRLKDFSHYKQKGEPWYSQPFYYRDGYKMRLVLHANGIGVGASSHISIVVLLLKGEFDDQLKWPLVYEAQERKADSVCIALQPIHKYSSEQQTPAHICCYCTPADRCQRVSDDDSYNFRIFGSEEKFLDHRRLDKFLFNDSVVIEVSLSHHSHRHM